MKKVICSLLAISLSVCSVQTTFADNMSSQTSKNCTVSSNSDEICNNNNKEAQIKKVQKLIKKELDSINKKTPVWRRVLAWPFKSIWNIITHILSSLFALAVVGGGAYFYLSRKIANLKSTSTSTNTNKKSKDTEVNGGLVKTTDNAHSIVNIETTENSKGVSVNVNVDSEIIYIVSDFFQEIKSPTPGGFVDWVMTEISQPTPGGTIDRFLNELKNPTQNGFFDQIINRFKDFNDIFASILFSFGLKFPNDFTNRNSEQYNLLDYIEQK